MKKILSILVIIFGLMLNLHAQGGSSGGSSAGSSGGSSAGSSGGSSAGSSDGYGGGGMSGQYTISTRGVYDQALKAIWNEIQQENYEPALASLQKYVYENPENSDGWNLIGFTSRKLMIFEDAEKYYNIGLEIDPEHEGILQYQGELYLETNRLDLAKSNLKKLEELCVFNCEEQKKLAQLINEFQSN